MVTSEPERYVKPAVAHKYWAKHAYEILVETAGRYNAVITYSELAEEVQRRSNLWTKAAMRSWISALLADLAKVSQLRGEPALTSLVVNKKDGQVGTGYDEVLRIAGINPSDDPVQRERHAAAARLECYRHWDADVPEDAQPTVVARTREPVSRPAARAPEAGTTRTEPAPRSSEARSTAARGGGTRRSAELRRGAVCPMCFMEMPVTGICSNCS